ncbi:MAG: aquaporin [Defluviitaleaceae bacterium]|nr:aquaporin [Defluviitaleaceae bacterium]
MRCMTENKLACFAEFIGSMFLIMAAVSPIILFVEVFESHIGVALIANAIAVSWVLCALIEIFLPISGAHFNPVVTLAKMLESGVKNFGLSKAAVYIFCQTAGGIAGIILTHMMFFEEKRGILFISHVRRSGAVYFSEVLGTFILVFVILMLGHKKVKSSRASIIVAFLVGGQVMATSSTMFSNPQVTFARFFTSSVAGIRPIDGIIFIAMQIAGALLAVAAYKIFAFKSSEIK